MKVLKDFKTTVQLDPIERFDVEWYAADGEYRRARVVEIQRTVYPAQGGGHGCVVFGTAYPYRQSGELGKRQENVHQLKALVDQIPPLLRGALIDQVMLPYLRRWSWRRPLRHVGPDKTLYAAYQDQQDVLALTSGCE